MTDAAVLNRRSRRAPPQVDESKLSQALQEEGLLDREAHFETMDQVLDGLERTSGHLATTFNLPPVDIPSLRREWTRFKDEVQTIPPKNVPRLDRVERVWNDLQASAREQGRSYAA